MSSVSIRQSGGANIISIPKAIVQTLGLDVGSKLNLTIQENSIVLTPIKDSLSLEELLAGSPKEAFSITQEDRDWIDEAPVGSDV